MAKDKKKQSIGKKATKKRAAASARSSPKPRTTKVAKAVRSAKKKAVDIAGNPAVAEIVAATLVAAAAALKDPKRARIMAAAAADEIESASKSTVKQGTALWQLALDVARRSIDALGTDKATTKSKASGKNKTKK